MPDTINLVSPEWLNEMWDNACRDDMMQNIVPSDVRLLIKTLRGAQKQLASAYAAVEERNQEIRRLREQIARHDGDGMGTGRIHKGVG